jgi:hypothetical protein
VSPWGNEAYVLTLRTVPRGDSKATGKTTDDPLSDLPEREEKSIELRSIQSPEHIALVFLWIDRLKQAQFLF